jgi:ubiquitin-like-conjugating enzyme ATG10
MHNASVFADYPFLTAEEFAEVCHYFDSAYRRAELGEQRRKWQLEVVLQTQYAPLGLDFGDSTYIKILRRLEPDAAEVCLSVGLQQLYVSQRGTETEFNDLVNDADMLEAEDADQVRPCDV